MRMPLHDSCCCNRERNGDCAPAPAPRVPAACAGSFILLLLPRGSQGYRSLLRDFLTQQQSISDSLVTSGREEVQVEVDGHQEIVDAFTRGGRLLLWNGSLAPFPQILLTGGTLRHWMPAPRVHLFVLSEASLVETPATHVAVIGTQLHVNRFHVHLQVLTPISAVDAAIAGASDAFSLMRQSVRVKTGLIR